MVRANDRRPVPCGADALCREVENRILSSISLVKIIDCAATKQSNIFLVGCGEGVTAMAAAATVEFLPRR